MIHCINVCKKTPRKLTLGPDLGSRTARMGTTSQGDELGCSNQAFDAIGAQIEHTYIILPRNFLGSKCEGSMPPVIHCAFRLTAMGTAGQFSLGW